MVAFAIEIHVNRQVMTECLTVLGTFGMRESIVLFRGQTSRERVSQSNNSTSNHKRFLIYLKCTLASTNSLHSSVVWLYSSIRKKSTWGMEDVYWHVYVVIYVWERWCVLAAYACTKALTTCALFHWLPHAPITLIPLCPHDYMHFFLRLSL